MESKQTADAQSNIIAIISYIMAGLALVSVIVFITSKVSSGSKIAVLREKGNAYVKAEDYEAAIEAYSEAIAIDPDNNDINCRLKYAQLMNTDAVVSMNEQDSVDNPADIVEDVEPEIVDESNAEVTADDPLKLGEESLCGFTWNDMFRDDDYEYLKNYAVNESGIEYDDCFVSDDGSRASYQTGDNNPEYYIFSVDDDGIIWRWQDDPDNEKVKAKISLSYYSGRNAMSFENLSSDKCRFFGLSRTELINNELIKNGITYSEGSVTKDGKPYGKSIDFDFKTIQGVETKACFWYDPNDELYLMTYNAE